jgi:hypothetical protein
MLFLLKVSTNGNKRDVSGSSSGKAAVIRGRRSRVHSRSLKNSAAASQSTVSSGVRPSRS